MTTTPFVAYLWPMFISRVLKIIRSNGGQEKSKNIAC
jgi:hypothetical protein